MTETAVTDAPDNTLRMMFVCQHDFAGPTASQMLGFAQGLVARGHAVLISVWGSADSARSEGLKTPPGIELHEHRFSGRRLRAVDREAAIAFAPTLVHAVNSRVPTVAATADYARATNAPVFVHFEDDEWHVWGGVPGESLYHRFGRVVRRLEATIHPVAWPHSTRRSRRWVRRSAVALDAFTPTLAAEVTRHFDRPCATLLPISSERNESPATPIELPAPLADLPLVVVTGTIFPFSLADTVQGLEAVAEVQRRGYEVGYFHAGNAHPRIDPTALAIEAGLAPGTFAFPGRVPFASIRTLLERATIVLQAGSPSDFNRLRLPAKLQGYLASGTPTITFATGFGELLIDREEVLKVHTAEPGELADRIVEALEHPELAATLAEGGPRAAQRLFDPGRNTEALLSHYREHLVPLSGRRRQAEPR